MQFKPDISGPLTPEWVLSRVSQEEIMERYLGMRVDLKGRVCSPFRRDRTPSCSFRYYGDKLRFRDWAKAGGRTTQDCFDIVQEAFSCDFETALQVVARDFGLRGKEVIYKPYRQASVIAQRARPTRADLRVKARDWHQLDADYLRPFGITRAACERYGVHPLQTVWLGGSAVWTHRITDPALGYFLGTDDEGFEHWKVYFWKRKRHSKRPRFYSNTSRIQGYNQLPGHADAVVLTKSMKDVLTLDGAGIPSLAPQSETAPVDDWLLDTLRNRFDRVLALYDRDRAGMRALVALRARGVETLMIPSRFGSKDASDLVRDHGLDVLRGLADHVRQG